MEVQNTAMTRNVNTKTVDRILDYLETNGPSKKTPIIRKASSGWTQGLSALNWMLNMGLITYTDDEKFDVVRHRKSRHHDF